MRNRERPKVGHIEVTGVNKVLIGCAGRPVAEEKQPSRVWPPVRHRARPVAPDSGRSQILIDSLSVTFDATYAPQPLRSPAGVARPADVVSTRSHLCPRSAQHRRVATIAAGPRTTR